MGKAHAFRIIKPPPRREMEEPAAMQRVVRVTSPKGSRPEAYRLPRKNIFEMSVLDSSSLLRPRPLCPGELPGGLRETVRGGACGCGAGWANCGGAWTCSGGAGRTTGAGWTGWGTG